MTVTCPNCKTIYNLSSDKARQNAKLRCSVCKEIFAMPDEAVPPASVSEPAAALASDAPQTPLSINLESSERPALKKSQPKGKNKFLLILLLLVSLFGGAYALMQNERTSAMLLPVLEPLRNLFGIGSNAPQEDSEEARLAALKAMVGQLQVRNLRQYTVTNEKIGKITIFEGKVANEFDEPRELIRVEGALYDGQGNLLTSKAQYAGSTVSLFQLQVLGEEELEQALNNKLDILTNNTNVPPGGMVPFMIVMYTVPENATDFAISVVDAKKPEPKS